MIKTTSRAPRHTSNVLKIAASRCPALIPPGRSVLVAVSGGPDSTALALLLHELSRKLGITKLGILHVNHGLRGKHSDRDERFVEKLARRIKAPYFVKTLSGRSLHDSGMEEWARKERYAFFHSVKEREGFDFIATGHTADDQVETVLMRIMRGTGIRGLRGILEQREDGVIRPLLTMRKAELLAWLKERKSGFRVDASNRDLALRRNWVRRRLVPEIERREKSAFCALQRAALSAQEFWFRFGPRVDEWVRANVAMAGGGFSVRKEGLADDLHAAEGLRSVFAEQGIPVDTGHVDEVLANRGRTNGTFLLPGNWSYAPGRRMVLFQLRNRVPDHSPGCVLAIPGTTVCAEKNVSFSVSLPSRPGRVPRDNVTVVLDRDRCGPELVFRPWTESDRFVPFGSIKPVRVDRFLAGQRLSKPEREEQWVVAGKNGRIIWVPGTRISNDCRITGETTSFLKILYQSCPVIV